VGNQTTTGYYNTIIGNASATGLLMGTSNTGVGRQVFYSLTNGGNNTALGNAALSNISTANGNTSVGVNSGFDQLAYTDCTFLGYQADASANSLTNATAIGKGAKVGTSNSLVLGNSANVGIGTSSPTTAGLVVTQYVTNVGTEASCIRAVSGQPSTKIEIQNTTASTGRLWEVRSSSTGIFDITDRTGSITPFYILGGTGRVGIGIATPDQLLTVYSSTPSKITAGGWTGYSDKRIKDVHGDYSSGLSEILKIKVRKFKFNKNIDYPEEVMQKEHIGVVAQEIEEIMPECIVDKVKKGDIEDMRTLDITPLTYALINAFQELHEKVERLEKQAA
jgi:hypothetical protein